MVWLPQDHGDALELIAGGAPQACGADLASGGAKGAHEAAEAWEIVAQR